MTARVTSVAQLTLDLRQPTKAAMRLRKFRATNPGYSTEKNAAWQKKNKEKRAAHKAVEVALLRGDLEKEPCVRCGTTQMVAAHHDDYSKPLDVMWLCPIHHRQRHKELAATDVAARAGDAAAQGVGITPPSLGRRALPGPGDHFGMAK